MQIDIFCKNITLDNPLRVFIEEKIGGLARYVKGDTMQMRVEVGKPSRHHRKGLVFYAEVNLKFGARILRAEALHNDLRTAITAVKDDLQMQIQKFKGKRTDLSRKSTKI